MDHHIILLHIVHSYHLHQEEVDRQHSQILQVVGDICIQPFQVLQVNQVIQAMETDTQTHTAVEIETQAHQIHTIHTMVIATEILTVEEIHMTTEIKAHHRADLRSVTFLTFCVEAAAAVEIVMEAAV